ncbi:MAG: disulfide bond formation protein B [Desulfobacterales bacterium]|nr:disulfide bond formation protein B [Desulfobacterales bacterium]
MATKLNLSPYIFNKNRERKPMSQNNNVSEGNWYILLAAWMVAAASTLGSIFFSHVMEFAPCVLCWYQRICLFPLVIILAIGLFPFDKAVVKYALPIAVSGWFVAAYHNLLYSGIIPQEMQPCTKGVSCTEKYIDLFGFLSIPMLSLIGFSILVSILFLLKKRTS